MNVSTDLEKKVKQIIKYFETGKITGTDYSCISIYNDGPNKIKQVTYGAFQTTEYGNLKALIEAYIKSDGKYSSEFSPYIQKIGKNPSLCTDQKFLSYLKLASSDPIMQITQDSFFDKFYYNPAIKWCVDANLQLPLSFLVVFDSFVHSGGILGFLRERFQELTPVRGGDEKMWVKQYVDARDEWLENHSNRILQNTDYRTDSFINAIRKNNWFLESPFEVVNFKTKDESDKPVVQVVIT